MAGWPVVWGQNFCCCSPQKNCAAMRAKWVWGPGRCILRTPYEIAEAIPGYFDWVARPWKPEYRLVRIGRPLIAASSQTIVGSLAPLSFGSRSFLG